jgi:predicted nuclease of predicted toxin-antitoxin system
LPNGLIFKKAYKAKRILLTFDLDFGEIVALSGGKMMSVVLFRLHNTKTQHVIDRLKKIIEDSQKALEEGAVVVVEETRHRIRRMPIGK